MNGYIPIYQEVIGSVPLDCEELRDSTNGLDIVFSSDGGDKLTVHFQKQLTYRLIDEGDALVMLDQFFESGGGGDFLYKVEKSDFLDWFHWQSRGLHINRGLFHYVIFAENDIIDVISFDDPVLNWSRVK